MPHSLSVMKLYSDSRRVCKVAHHDRSARRWTIHILVLFWTPGNGENILCFYTVNMRVSNASEGRAAL